MLKLRYLFENFDLAREALTHWTHDEASLDETLGWYRISSNAVYPYVCDDKLCFLRLSPVEEKDECNLKGELAFLVYLRANDYPSMRAIPSTDGQTLLKLHTQWGDYYASAFERVSGTQLEDVELTDGVMRAYGRALGKLHSLSSRYQPLIRKWNEQDALEWTEAVLREYHAPESTLAYLANLRHSLSKLPKTPDNYGLVHYDFEPDNVFYDENTDECSVIDFEDGMYHWFALDVEQAFGELDEILDESRRDAAKQAFLQGYREMFAMSDEALQMLPLMRSFVELFGYARVLRSLSDTFENEPEWMTELRQKLMRRIRSFEAHCDSQQA